jgi:hypothetical protein
MFCRLGFWGFTLFVISFLPTQVVGQVYDHAHYHEYGFENDFDYTTAHLSVIDFITHLYRKDIIPKDEAFNDIISYLSDDGLKPLIEKKFSVYEKNEKVGVVFGDEHSTTKCLTLFVLEFNDKILNSPEAMDLLGFATGQTTNKNIGDHPVTQQFQFTSGSGRFVVYYDTTGTTAVPVLDSNGSGFPDYVELTAAYADSSFNHLVERLGFRDPLSRLNPIPIRYHNSSAYYGYASNGIYVHRNFIGFPPNYDANMPIGALKVTIAHELKHLIQFATTNVIGSSNPLYNWIELDATMAEEVVFPTVKDYLNYIRNNSIFTHPQLSIPKTLSYQQVTFGLYFRERFGDEFWVNIWNRLANSGSRSMFREMENELSSKNHSIDYEIVQAYLWHFASGPRYSPGFGFKDSEFYPGVQSESPSGLPLPISTSYSTVNRRGAKYFLFDPGNESADKIVSGLFRENRRVHLGIIGFFKDKSVKSGIITENSSLSDINRPYNFAGLSFEWPTDELEVVGIVVVNNSDNIRSSQIITGTERSPSAIRYGDINGDGISTVMDAELILDHKIGFLTAPNLNSPLSQLKSDVSGDGTISTFDASIILKRANDIIPAYPVDLQNEIFVPGVSWFTPANSDPVLSKALHHSNAITTVSSDSVRFSYSVGNVPNDDKLRIMIHLDDTTSIFSSFIEMEYDDNLLNYVGFNTIPIFENQQISKFQVSDGNLRLALARSTPMENTMLFEVVFSPLADTTTTVKIISLQLDEKISVSPNFEITAKIAPSDGVGIPKPIEIPLYSRLLNNYPNPFNPTTVIPFELPSTRNVKIQVLDVTGRVVQTLTEDVYPGGYHQLVFNATNLSSGVYIVRMVSMDPVGDKPPEQSVHRILLLK